MINFCYHAEQQHHMSSITVIETSPKSLPVDTFLAVNRVYVYMFHP